MYYTNYSPLGSTPDEIKLGDCVTVLISGPRDLVRWSKSTYMVIDVLNPCKVLLENGMKQVITMTIKRNSGYAELGISKKFPVVSDLDVVMDAMNNSNITTGKCKKIKEQNL